MKKLVLMLACLTGVLLSSCGKDDNPTAPTAAAPGISGLWIGKYGSATAYPSSGYSFYYRADGSVRVYDGADTAAASKAEGTYTLVGSTVASTYTYLGGGSTFSTTATVNTQFTFIEGTWGPGSTPSGSGLYFVVKQ
ncbi:MAG: hypothetical protein ABL977_16230 [Candidatus Eisenbacteria bacterium]